MRTAITAITATTAAVTGLALGYSGRAVLQRAGPSNRADASAAPVDGSTPAPRSALRAQRPAKPLVVRPEAARAGATGRSEIEELVPRELMIRNPAAGIATEAAAARLKTRVVERLLGVEHDTAIDDCLDRVGVDVGDRLLIDIAVRASPDRVELAGLTFIEPAPGDALDACVRTLVDPRLSLPHTVNEAPYLLREGTVRVAIPFVHEREPRP